MTEYTHLLGAEDVSRAAHNMCSAARDMMRAAEMINEAVNNQQRFIEQSLVRFEEIAKSVEKDE